MLSPSLSDGDPGAGVSDLVANSSTGAASPTSVWHRRSASPAFWAFVFIVLGTSLRIYEALHIKWRDDETVYVVWTGQWFSSHLIPYLFQFQQHIYPPKSPYFGNPPLAMWLFGISIFLGKIVGVAALYAARCESVIISVVTCVMIWRVGRRWLGDVAAAFASSAFSLLPLAVTTGSSAYIEPLLTLLVVLAIDGFLRLRVLISLRTTVYLSTILALSLLTKFSYVAVFGLLGLLGLVHLVQAKKTALAVTFTAICFGLPVVVWSGFRTPSQYSGVFSFLSQKYSGPSLRIDYWRYPLSLLSDFPTVLLLAWLGVLAIAIISPRARRTFPPYLLLVSLLPVVALTELVVTAPTSWDYQLLPMTPLIFLSVGWLVQRYVSRRSSFILFAGLVVAESVFMFGSLGAGQLSLASTPLGTVIRHVEPSIDVPYGTGSETFGPIAKYVNQHFGPNIQLTTLYVNYNLNHYLRTDQATGAWFENEPIEALAAQGIQYAVYINHYASPNSPASISVRGLTPVFRVEMAQGTVGEIFRVPYPTLGRTPILNWSATGSTILTVPGVKIVSSTIEGARVSIGAEFLPGAGARYFGVSRTASVKVGKLLKGTSLQIVGRGGSENMYLDLTTPSGAFYRATIAVDWIGPQRVWLNRLDFVAQDAAGVKPTWLSSMGLQILADSPSGVQPYIDVRQLSIVATNG